MFVQSYKENCGNTVSINTQKTTTFEMLYPSKEGIDYLVCPDFGFCQDFVSSHKEGR